MSAPQDLRQGSQYLSITTAAGEGALQLSRIRGREAMSEPFAYDLELYANGAGPSCASLIGTEASVAIKAADGTTRHIHGVLTGFGISGAWPDPGRTFFRARLEPKLALLDLTGDCRIFQSLSAVDIATQVLSGGGVTAVKKSLSAGYTARDYCVQWRESDLAFIRRLLEDEGIGFWFSHATSAHTLVLADSANAYTATPGTSTIHWRPDAGAGFEDDAAADCALELRLRPDSFGTDAWSFETPSAALYAKAAGSGSKRLLNDWDGRFASAAAGEKLAKLRLAAHEATAKLLRLRGSLRSLACGQSFTLAGHPRAELNGSWAVLSVTLDATPDCYEAEVVALPAATVFRPLPAVPRPRIASAQTAIVTGPAGEEIHTDKYGRVKVQFHWDRVGKADDTSSCWLRVVQGWAGTGFGAHFTPRVGTEVVIGFLDGDPDQPLVIGAVHNAERTLPYAMPANKTRSTIRTKSSPKGAADAANELRFEDKTGSEEVYLRAQKDLTVEVLNDVTETITHDRTTSIDNDDTLTVKQARKVTVSEGDESLTVSKGKRSVTVKGDETHTNSGDFTHKVSGDYSLTVGGDMTLTVTGKLTIKAASVAIEGSKGTVALKAATSLDLDANSNIALSANAKLSGTGKAGVSLSSTGQLDIKGAMANFKADAMGEVSAGGILTVKGALVKIN
ncbi:type VI secretion system Vgr family protein [Paracraurococcus ruber]|nr:type VI secretion system tip protein TssI/VgrG [Paracraurococcus ruber]TDG28741.1 type VI secretion system tip protein VgrG [Paracraurococcus ruber]